MPISSRFIVHTSFFPDIHTSSRPIIHASPHPIVPAAPHLVVHGLSQIINSSHPPKPAFNPFPKSREGLVRKGEFLADQACLSVQASPKNIKIQKKLLSLDQVSYALTSCNHSSLTGNQCGSSSYSLSHLPITVQVYASHAHHSPPSTCPPSESHAKWKSWADHLQETSSIPGPSERTVSKQTVHPLPTKPPNPDKRMPQ